MPTIDPRLTEAEIQSYRDEHYNATVTYLWRPTRHLMRVRVRLDEGVREDGLALNYEPGQYTTLGMGYWEPRVPEADPEDLDEKKLQRMVKRAYSISCRLLDDNDRVTPAGGEDEVEFYIALVLKAEKAPPALTPRLFVLRLGDRLHMGGKPKGVFTLEDVKPTDNVLLAGTGTGEAPHNAMASKLLANGHQGKITNVCCVRYREDLGYTREHNTLMREFPNYRYVPLTTRELENRDTKHPEYSGVRYVQDLLDGEGVADEIGFELDPGNTQVYLCGNPSMIGIPNKADHPEGRYPTPRGVVEVLEEKGFKADEPKSPGNIHYEKYW